MTKVLYTVLFTSDFQLINNVNLSEVRQHGLFKGSIPKYWTVAASFFCQAMNVEGDLVGDFVFESGLGSRVLHCRNAPSPGATSSLAIGRMMADKAAEEFGLPKRQNAELY